MYVMLSCAGDLVGSKSHSLLSRIVLGLNAVGFIKYCIQCSDVLEGPPRQLSVEKMATEIFACSWLNHI